MPLPQREPPAWAPVWSVTTSCVNLGRSPSRSLGSLFLAAEGDDRPSWKLAAE